MKGVTHLSQILRHPGNAIWATGKQRRGVTGMWAKVPSSEAAGFLTKLQTLPMVVKRWLVL